MMWRSEPIPLWPPLEAFPKCHCSCLGSQSWELSGTGTGSQTPALEALQAPLPPPDVCWSLPRVGRRLWERIPATAKVPRSVVGNMALHQVPLKSLGWQRDKGGAPRENCPAWVLGEVWIRCGCTGCWYWVLPKPCGTDLYLFISWFSILRF